MAENIEEVSKTSESLEEKPEEKEVELNGVEEDEEEKVDDDEEKAEDDDEKKESEESGSNESDEELGSLEKPVQILTNKRDRKSVERYVDNSEEKSKSKSAEELDYTKGKGLKLGEIEFVNHSLDRTKSDELKQMHRLLFGRIAKAVLAKRNIRAFCGYPFEKDTIHYERLEQRLDRMLTTDLKFICGILGLERPSSKEALKENLVEYLICPKDLGKNIPKSKQKRKSKTPSKKRKSKDGNKKKKQKDDKELDSTKNSDSESDDEEEEKKTPSPKKKSKKADSAKKSSSKKKEGKKTIKVSIGGKKSSEKKSKKRKEMSSDDDSDDDDEPLIKKTKKEPADDDIKSAVEGILKGADLEQVTMKTVCKQVYDKFPDFDLTPRKDFIKATVKEIIS